MTRLNPKYIPLLATAIVLVAVFGTGSALYPNFGTPRVFVNLLNDNAFVGVAAIGESFVILSGAQTKILTYALAGSFCAAGGVVATFYMQSGNPASFVGLELDAIASVVIGGTLLTGGVGFIPGTLMGVLILGLIQTLINFNGTLNSWWTKIVIGVLLLIFIVLQKLISRRAVTQL
jgi:galactofuranose transport system permease protein